jgi:hypothetical protein
MKFNKAILAVSLFPSYARGNKCIKESPLELGTSACSYGSLVASVKQRLDNPDIMSYDAVQCPHSAAEELGLHLGTNLTESEMVEIVSNACETANVKNPIGTLAWSEVTGKGDKFDKEYYDGNGEWNEEHQTNYPHPPYYEGQPSNVLKRDAQRIDDLYEGVAQSVPIQWPGDSPTSMSNFANCELQSAMCCWVSDRQANDNNGNCHTPYDTKCLDADPADNTQLCGVSMKRSISDAVHVNDGFAVWEENEEGPIHCHGLAWGMDENEPDFRYRANNLFYVSMSDHLHDRGYTRAVQGSPMCACVENMPLVTRSDCTEIKATELFTFTLSDENLAASVSYTEIDFNACAAQTNNDLQSFYERLLNEGRVTKEKYDKFRQTIRGNDNCPSAYSDLVFEQGYTFTPLAPGDFTGLDGKCLKGNGQDQTKGQILLESGDFSSESKKQECLETCSSFSESIHVTGCEAASNGCYLHTDEVKYGSNDSNGNRMCYLPNRYQPPDLVEEPGFCVSGPGHGLHGLRKLATGDYGPSEEKKKECHDMCRDFFKREKINGCTAVWHRSNRGCYAYTDNRLFRGSNHDRHACWIPETFETPNTEDFYSEPGHCLDGNGNDQNDGVAWVASGNYFSSEQQQQAGLDLCREAARKGEITACEVTTSGVYMHTKEVQSANSHSNHQCFIAKGPVSVKK